MFLVWSGVLLIVLKFLAVEPVAALSWWWVLAPLAAAIAWFEIFESKFGFDRRRAENTEWERGRAKRIAAHFGLGRGARGRKGPKPPKS